MDAPTKKIQDSKSHFIRKGIHLCYSKLIEPRSADVEARRYEYILNIILVSVISIIALLDLSLILGNIETGMAYRGVSFFVFTVFLTILMLLLYISRRGWIRTASYSFILILLSIITLGQIHYGMALPAALLSDALLITIATILINRRFGILLSLLIGTILIALAYHENVNNIIPAWKLEPTYITNGIQYAFILFSITLISLLYRKEIEKALSSALASEKLLQEKNEHLEIIIDERTRLLKQAQVEKMSQLYRFVEFGRLSSGIFHDIMNPLSAVTLNVKNLETNLHTDIPEIKENLYQAILACKKIESFMESLKKQVNTSSIVGPFEVNKEIEEAIVLFEYKARTSGVSMHFSAQQKMHLNGNSLKFHQVIANLLSNAIDSYEHERSDGQEKGAEKIICVYLNKKGKNLEIRIRDHGIGIDPAMQERIFEPFFTTKGKDKGMGIGLSAAKDIIEKDFSGTLRVTSSLGAGSTFIILLPYHS